MPRKQFVADLERLSKSGAAGSCVTGLKRGDDDGTFTFTFDAKRPGVKSVEVAGTVPELFDYPSSHQLLIYTTSSDAPAYASRALEDLSVDSLDLEQAIYKISDKLQKALAPDNDGFEDYEDFEDLEGSDSDEGSVGGWSDDELQIDVDGDSQMVDGSGPEAPERKARRHALIKELRNDLRRAKTAGFKVGVLGDWRGGINFYVALGVRVGKLGISEEATNAWKLDRTKYFIVLIHYSNYYQTLERLTGEIAGYHAKKGVALCVGTSSRYKPTLQEAINSFSRFSSGAENPGQHVIGTTDGLETELDASRKQEWDFEGIFISGPLNQLLNSTLVPLLKYRLRFGFPWEGAELYYSSNQGGKETGLAAECMDDRYYEVHPPKNPLAPILMTDALQGPATEASFPLLAMQFALRHLVRCTEFCLVCHSRVSTDFEALKPYVCSNPLCLYQYMSLGFGPSIEHEIVSLPTVVDLLVSFCYTSAKASKLKDFPVGMDLKVPSVNSQTWKVNYYGNKGEFLFDDADNDMRSLLKEGDWIIIPVPGTASSEEWHARITETCYYPTVKIAQPVGSQLVGSKSTPGTSLNSVQGINSPSLSGKQTPDNSASGGIFGADDGEMKEVTFKIYDTSFDDLPDDEKRKTIINILNTLPRVAEMKEWLQKNTNVGDEASLRKWRARISPTALGVLRWIIASNRSCIVPLDESEENPASGFLPVQGMGEWKQFRFAMGAPDKEQRFVSSVKQAHQRLNLQYPSLFAFHGSPLQNWHSIIREGLHFKETAHGRAFGHGCYHSLDLGTSIGYSSVMPHGMSGQVAGYWPQSELKITTALSLNEIVNSPNEFVSKSPHLVVAQLDWIQTRYLFVKSLPDPNGNPAGSTPKTSLNSQMIHPQDPAYTPRNGATRLVIPSTPSSRQRITLADSADVEMIDAPPISTPSRKKKKNKIQGAAIAGMFYGTGNSADDPYILDPEDQGSWDDASITTDTEDLLALLSDDEEERHEPEVDKGKGKEVVPAKPARIDEFQPGTLDTSQIQFLKPPSYASSMATKRLSSDLQSIIKLQESTPLEQLGFYINPDHVDNVYQWIVELHSFPETLPLVQDMCSKNPILRSIVLEIRFGPQYPMTPPFVRVVKPRFLGFNQGGGGNVTLGGAMCMELLTNSGWSAVSTVESVLMQVRLAMMDEERPARLERGAVGSYSVAESVEAFKRACRNHGWKEPEGMESFIRQ